jgi:peroxiredoxin
MSLTIGGSLPGFRLPATDGREYSADELCGECATVILFWCNHCPYVVACQDRVIVMQNEYAGRGVRFAAICCNSTLSHPSDGFEAMQVRAVEKGYNFPYLRDESQEVARAFGATRTPEAFLFDARRRLAYHGRIDDNWEDLSQVRRHDLRLALETVLAGRQPDPPETGAVGCSIKWKQVPRL